MSIVVRDSRKPGQKVIQLIVCSVAIVSLWLCVPPVGGNSPLVAVIATEFFSVNSHCEKKKKKEKNPGGECPQTPIVLHAYACIHTRETSTEVM